MSSVMKRNVTFLTYFGCNSARFRRDYQGFWVFAPVAVLAGARDLCLIGI